MVSVSIRLFQGVALAVAVFIRHDEWVHAHV
jgi:hypothetical protein